MAHKLHFCRVITGRNTFLQKRRHTSKEWSKENPSVADRWHLLTLYSAGIQFEAQLPPWSQWNSSSSSCFNTQLMKHFPGWCKVKNTTYKSTGRLTGGGASWTGVCSIHPSADPSVADMSGAADSEIQMVSLSCSDRLTKTVTQQPAAPVLPRGPDLWGSEGSDQDIQNHQKAVGTGLSAAF